MIAKTQTRNKSKLIAVLLATTLSLVCSNFLHRPAVQAANSNAVFLDTVATPEDIAKIDVNAKQLYIRDYRFADLTVLPEMPNLMGLSIKSGQTPGLQGLESLQGVEKYANTLTALWIGENYHLSDISSASALTKLLELNIDLTDVEDITPVAQLPTLQTLSLRHTIVNAGLNLLKDNTRVNLETVSLHIKPLSSRFNTETGMYEFEFPHLSYHGEELIPMINDFKTNHSLSNQEWGAILSCSNLDEILGYVHYDYDQDLSIKDHTLHISSFNYEVLQRQSFDEILVYWLPSKKCIFGASYLGFKPTVKTADASTDTSDLNQTGGEKVDVSTDTSDLVPSSTVESKPTKPTVSNPTDNPIPALIMPTKSSSDVNNKVASQTPGSSKKDLVPNTGAHA